MPDIDIYYQVGAVLASAIIAVWRYVDTQKKQIQQNFEAVRLEYDEKAKKMTAKINDLEKTLFEKDVKLRSSFESALAVESRQNKQIARQNELIEVQQNSFADVLGRLQNLLAEQEESQLGLIQLATNNSNLMLENKGLKERNEELEPYEKRTAELEARIASNEEFNRNLQTQFENQQALQVGQLEGALMAIDRYTRNIVGKNGDFPDNAQTQEINIKETKTDD